MANIVIVESPAKIKKISSYLGPNFKVMASVGHFRDLPKKSLGIDINNNYEATYEITNAKVVSELKKVCANAKTIYLAPDNDREGHGISWHLMEVLKISYPKAKRMVFNEITKTAIQAALVEADRNGRMDMNAVNSYKARRFVDKITGFKVSPLLWKNISGAKSAGRVQSVATKLVTDKEEEINKHIPEEKYNISGIFLTDKKNDFKEVHAHLKQTPKIHNEALEVLKLCKDADFKVSENNKKTVFHSPPPAFKTSVFQQEAGKRYGISPKDAMRIAQNLYEKGKISYHRTDVTRLSDQFKNEVKQYVESKYGNEYLSDEMKKFELKSPDSTPPIEEKKSKSKKENKSGEQAAHEAIRPTDINDIVLGEGFDQKDKLLYRMIWVRAVASLMAKEKCHQYSIIISLSNTDRSKAPINTQAKPDTEKYWFTASYLLSIFLGFKILNVGNDNGDVESIEEKDDDSSKKNEVIMNITKDDDLTYKIIESKQSYTEPPKRFTESTLVQELEKKGIGRPSTYANIITTIQKRNYAVKQKSTTVKKDCLVDTLKNGEVTSKTIKVDFGDNKQRLFPTDLGVKVTSFLVSNVGLIMDYKFTSNLENELDDVSTGNKEWVETVDGITKILTGLIDVVPVKSSEEKIKNKTDRIIGKHEGSNMEFYVGKYGPFIKYDGKCYSLPKEHIDVSTVTLEIAIASMEKKVKSTNTNCLVSHDCKISGKKGVLQGTTGPYGNYLRFTPETGKSTNYFFPKKLKEDNEAVKNLTLEECLEFVEVASNYKPKKPYKKK
jgi:DNA topoisomerase-1